jgi:hypothetical protein
MFGASFAGGLIGLFIGLLMVVVNLFLQLRSREDRFEWRDPLVYSLVIAGAFGVVVAIGGLLNGDRESLQDAAGVFVPAFALIGLGSFGGRVMGWLLKRLVNLI